jgi:hypothetical protein
MAIWFAGQIIEMENVYNPYTYKNSSKSMDLIYLVIVN